MAPLKLLRMSGLSQLGTSGSYGNRRRIGLSWCRTSDIRRPNHGVETTAYRFDIMSGPRRPVGNRPLKPGRWRNIFERSAIQAAASALAPAMFLCTCRLMARVRYGMRVTNREEQEPIQEAARGTAAPSAPVNAADPIAMALRSRALAVRHYNAGQVAKAQAICREILALKPNYVDSLQLLGVIAQRAGCHRAAKDMFCKAIALNNGIRECDFNFGPAYSGLGRLEDCVEHFREATRLEFN